MTARKINDRQMREPWHSGDALVVAIFALLFTLAIVGLWL